jgi:hypothetical protein
MIQSELIADAKDIVGQMSDLAQTWTAEAGTPSFQVLMGMPQVTADLQAGGFMERVNHEVRIVAETAQWTTAYGSVCAAALSSGSPVASLAIGKTLIATEQGSRKYRIEGSTYKPGSAWVILQVRAQEER